MLKIREEAYEQYFHFMEVRMAIFWNRLLSNTLHSEDSILNQYKFTNVYRILDRVSQYLVRNVIYHPIHSFGPEDTLFRVLLFKIFNRIDTWLYLEEALEEPICIANFDPQWYTDLLAYRIQQQPIFNGAYLMTASHKSFQQYTSKHERWLRMVQQEFIEQKYFFQILETPHLEALYKKLLDKPLIGPFLAYQYAIDFNYTPFLNFDENSFVKAGIGAIRGIKKCFPDRGTYSYEDCIRYTFDHFDQFLDQYHASSFKALPGRPPTLIDLQNCFCETDKYLRVRMPELNLENTRIKQKYRPQKEKISYYFPPKWKITNFPF